MKKNYLTSVACLILSVSVTTAVAQNRQADSSARKTPFEWNFSKYRVGGYGEILFQYMTFGTNRYTNPAGATRDNRAEISLPRAVFAFDYHLGKGWYLGSEIEFEYGGTGATKEIEYDKEGGEIETEIEKGVPDRIRAFNRHGDLRGQIFFQVRSGCARR